MTPLPFQLQNRLLKPGAQHTRPIMLPVPPEIDVLPPSDVPFPHIPVVVDVGADGDTQNTWVLHQDTKPGLPTSD